MAIDPHIFIPPGLSAAAIAGRPAGGRILAIGGETMGTSWSARIALAGDPPAGVDAALQAELDRVIAEMSHWEAGSALSRFNRLPAGRWQALPPDFFTVLDRGLAIARESGGAFDPAAGALVDIWGFGAGGGVAAPPTQTEIATARACGGHQRLEIDRHARRALQPGGAKLDFSGIAKGHAVDLLAGRLRSLGLRHFLVEIGGELVGAGVQPDGQPWWVDLEAPPGLDPAPARIALHEMAVATSGDYLRWFAADGRRYAHTIDPRSGWPVANGLVSVSVVHRHCIDADAWATALTVLGPDAGMALATAKGLAARFINEEGGEAFSPALAAMLD